MHNNNIMHMHTGLPNTIGRFKTSQHHPISAWISWEALRKDVTGYIVQVEGADSTQAIPIRNKHSTSLRISDLMPSTQYTFEVRALKGMNKVHLTHSMFAFLDHNILLIHYSYIFIL